MPQLKHMDSGLSPSWLVNDLCSAVRIFDNVIAIDNLTIMAYHGWIDNHHGELFYDCARDTSDGVGWEAMVAIGIWPFACIEDAR